MKIIITGSVGNISKPLAAALIGEGHQVTIISSSRDKVPAIEALGATAAIGSVGDENFLAGTFSGADAVYTMVPPNFAAPDFRAYANATGKNYATAIQKAGIKKVVNLSSIGAHLDNGTGPIKGLHDVELVLDAIEGIDITHLRAGFFYINFFGNIDMIKHMHIIGSNYDGSTVLRMVHPADIAAAAAKAITTAVSPGIKIQYIVSDERSAKEVAGVLGNAIGKPELPWVAFSDEQALGGMLQAGLPQEMASLYVEMGKAAGDGRLWEDFEKNKKVTGTTKLEDFAREFAKVYGA